MLDTYPPRPPLARPRARLSLWQTPVALGIWLLAACASNDTWRPGLSDRPAVVAERPRSPAQGSAVPWIPMAALSSFVAVDDRTLPSSGHNPPYWSGVVRVSPSLEPIYRQMSADVKLPVGAVAVEGHADLSGNAQAIYAMEKHEPGYDPAGGDWEYVVLRADGEVDARGVLSLCARCHAEAPHDHLFGPRLSARRHVEPARPTGSVEAPTEREEDAGLSPDESEGPTPGGKTDRPRKRRKK